MKKNFLYGLIAMVLLCVSCGGKKQQEGVDKEVRAEIVADIEDLQKTLPSLIPNTPIKMTEVSVDGDLAVVVLELPQEVLGAQFLDRDDAANSDKNIARMLSGVKRDFVEKLIQGGLGIKYIYKDIETGETLLTIEADAKRIKQIQDGIESGSITPYSTLEVFQLEIDSYDFPCEMGEGVWLTDAYIKGNTVYYIASVDVSWESGDLSSEELREMKQGIVDGLNASLFGIHKEGMEQGGITIVYVYKNSYGEEYARVEITADDIDALQIN